MSQESKTALQNAANRAIEEAKKRGVKDVRATASRARDVSVVYRKGQPDKIEESSRKGLSLALYIDGKYTVCSTNDLRDEALSRFLDSSVELCKAMTPDEFRVIPDPALYKDRQNLDLKLFDSSISNVTPGARRDLASKLEEATLKEAGEKAISGEATYQDSEGEIFQLHSNGFEGYERDTQFWSYTELAIQDEGDKRPNSYAEAGSHSLLGLESPEEIGRRAAKRALARLGASKVETQKTTMIVENHVVGRILGHLLRATSGRALQQKESFLEGKVGEKIGSDVLTLIDDPFVPGGFGSRLFDGEGISAKRLPIFEQGVFRNFFIDTYYGKKLGMPPTTGGSSNLVITPGKKNLEELVADVNKGILVTGFIGGNSNTTTGDFSTGVFGTLIEKGKLTKAVAEMNIAGNHNDLWKRLIAVGNDPYPYSSTRSPSLVFDEIQFSGA